MRLRGPAWEVKQSLLPHSVTSESLRLASIQGEGGKAQPLNDRSVEEFVTCFSNHHIYSI